jgi:hypothetical protein
MDALTVRFDEWTRYDPQTDCEVVCLLGITGKGSFHIEVEAEPSSLRAKRKLFKDYVIQALEDGVQPGEVSFG